MLLAIVLVLAVTDMLPAGLLPDPVRRRPVSDQRVPIAMLGDSDTHGFADTIWYPREKGDRGGAYRDITLQWTEVLARLRPDEVDLGDVGVWGGRGKVVHVMEWFGCERRAPRKIDHEYNFALGGAGCHDLLEGPYRQVPRLLALMDRDPERWRRGVVVVRIGICDLGSPWVLDAMAQDPNAPELVHQIRSCTDYIATAVSMLHARHPATRVVLVGILDNADYPPLFDRWRTGRAMANIRAGLDHFDARLQQLAKDDPRIVFVDDRAWFRERFGSRDAEGVPAYRAVTIGASIRVEHAVGDAPSHSVLQDGHAGLVWNTLWAQSMVDVLTTELGLKIRPVTATEVEQFLGPLFEVAQRVTTEGAGRR